MNILFFIRNLKVLDALAHFQGFTLFSWWNSRFTEFRVFIWLFTDGSMEPLSFISIYWIFRLLELTQEKSLLTEINTLVLFIRKLFIIFKLMHESGMALSFEGLWSFTDKIVTYLFLLVEFQVTDVGKETVNLWLLEIMIAIGHRLTSFLFDNFISCSFLIE